VWVVCGVCVWYVCVGDCVVSVCVCAVQYVCVCRGVCVASVCVCVVCDVMCGICVVSVWGYM